jgi:hypothetical protein
MRRLVFECELDGFRTSPLVLDAGATLLGLDAVTIQLAEHTLASHADRDDVQWVSVDMPEVTP